MELTKAQKIALRVATLSLQSVPQDDFRNHNHCIRVWEAFNLGREYQKQEAANPP